MDSTILRGVYCPVLTPFDQQLNPDVDRFVEHCKNLLNQGCHGLAVFGTTGEATSLSVRERIDLLDALLEADTVIANAGRWEGEVELLDSNGVISEQTKSFTFTIEESY